MHISNSNFTITPLGGFAVKLKNYTGETSVYGKLVGIDTSVNGGVKLTTADQIDCIGVIYTSGVAQSGDIYVVIGGIAEVLLNADTAAVRGYWVGTGATGGYAQTSASPASSTTHFQEVGHSLESKNAVAGSHILNKILMHFN